MDPVTLITTMALAGSATVGTELVKEATKDLYHRFMTRLKGKAAGNEEATTALVKADDAEAVHHAVQTVHAASDPEIVTLAEQLNRELPRGPVQQAQLQIAKVINNISGSTVNQTYNL